MQILLIIIIVLLLGVVIYLWRRDANRRFTEESFLAVVNHAFRTPLTSIKWMSETLEQEIPRKEQIEIAKNLKTSVGRLLDVLDTLAGIKDIHNSSTYDLKAVSLREILEQALLKESTALHDKKISLSLPPFHDIPYLSIDTKKISFVMQVLIENAIAYVEEGGKIVIDCFVKDEKLVLSIADSGIGLSNIDKRNMFVRFYRGHRAKTMNTDGMGIGLSLARDIIKRHNGTMKAYSNGVDKGATFIITLPIKK